MAYLPEIKEKKKIGGRIKIYDQLLNKQINTKMEEYCWTIKRILRSNLRRNRFNL